MNNNYLSGGDFSSLELPSGDTSLAPGIFGVPDGMSGTGVVTPDDVLIPDSVTGPFPDAFNGNVGSGSGAPSDFIDLNPVDSMAFSPGSPSSLPSGSSSSSSSIPSGSGDFPTNLQSWSPSTNNGLPSAGISAAGVLGKLPGAVGMAVGGALAVEDYRSTGASKDDAASHISVLNNYLANGLITQEQYDYCIQYIKDNGSISSLVYMEMARQNNSDALYKYNQERIDKNNSDKQQTNLRDRGFSSSTDGYNPESNGLIYNDSGLNSLLNSLNGRGYYDEDEANVLKRDIGNLSSIVHDIIKLISICSEEVETNLCEETKNNLPELMDMFDEMIRQISELTPVIEDIEDNVAWHIKENRKINDRNGRRYGSYSGENSVETPVLPIDTTLLSSIIGTITFSEVVTMYQDMVGGTVVESSLEANYGLLDIVKYEDKYYYKIIDKETMQVYYVLIDSKVSVGDEIIGVLEIKEDTMMLSSTEIGTNNFEKIAAKDSIYFVKEKVEVEDLEFIKVIDTSDGKEYFIPMSESVEYKNLDQLNSNDIDNLEKKPIIENTAEVIEEAAEPIIDESSGSITEDIDIIEGGK